MNKSGASVPDRAATPAGPSPETVSGIAGIPCAAFNVNEKVLLKLTPLGEQIMEQDHLHYFPNNEPPYSPLKKDRDGFVAMQLWEVMHLFGPHVYNGAKPPFETTIKIPCDCGRNGNRWDVKQAQPEG